MKGERFFKIPENSEIMATLIRAVPDDWAWLDGSLQAPENLVKSGEALPTTGFAFHRFQNNGIPIIVGGFDPVDQRRRLKPDYDGIIVGRKMPGFIGFDESAYQTNQVRLGEVRDLAASFVARGYRGNLDFFLNCCDYENKYSSGARCSIFLRSSLGQKTPQLYVEWNSRFGGKEAHLEPIYQACANFQLREFVPEVCQPGI